MKIRPQVKPASRGADEGWAVLSTLISGFVVFGGIGWLLDRWWGTHLMVPIGVIVGMALSIYAVVLQFGRPDGQGGAKQAPAAVRSTTAAAALRTEKALNRARAVDRTRAVNAPAAAQHAVAQPAARQPAVARALPPNDGPPPASTRRETECL